MLGKHCALNPGSDDTFRNQACEPDFLSAGRQERPVWAE